MSRDEILLDAEERMEKSVEVLKNSLVGIRTGQASTGLVESIRVEYYGSSTPLKQLANLSAPEPQLIVIRPFDVAGLKDIEKAILASDLGLTPSNDGKVIRLKVPSLSGEQRKKLGQRVKELAEAQRVSIRNVRRDANKAGDNLEKEGGLSEDDLKTLKDEIQEMTKTYEQKVNDLADKKTKEIME